MQASLTCLLCDALAPYLWSRSFGWRPAKGYRKRRSAPAYWPMRLGNDFTFYPRDAMLARVIEIATCLSVHLSVTRRNCVKTKKASGMISSPSGSPRTLVFLRQISSPNTKGFSPNGGLKQGSVGKIQRFFSFKRQYLENGSRYGQSYY